MIFELLQAQLMDPFRIGLLVAMIFTARNTAAQAGHFMPILMGIVFVAVLIPITLGAGQSDSTMAIAVGLMSNAIIVAVVWAIWEAIARIRQG